MSKHTPGPWRVVERTDTTIEADGYIGQIADVRSDLSYAWNDPEMLATKQANARLIAAAPELLEALEMCRSAILGGELVPGYDSIGPGYNQVFGRAFIKHLGKVISKARGEA